jgi:hypothetical protein
LIPLLNRRGAGQNPNDQRLGNGWDDKALLHALPGQHLQEHIVADEAAAIGQQAPRDVPP